VPSPAVKLEQDQAQTPHVVQLTRMRVLWQKLSVDQKNQQAGLPTC
jgi:hypothetical protein